LRRRRHWRQQRDNDERCRKQVFDWHFLGLSVGTYCPQGYPLAGRFHSEISLQRDMNAAG
jgi:hypothetical protein